MSTRNVTSSSLLTGVKWPSNDMRRAVVPVVDDLCDERDSLYDRIDLLEETVNLLSTKIHADHEVDVQRLGMQAANKVMDLIESSPRMTTDAIADVFMGLMKDLTERAVGFKALCNAYELRIEQLHNGYDSPDHFGMPANHLVALDEVLDESLNMESLEIQVLGEEIEANEKLIKQLTKDLELARGTPGRLWTLISNIKHPIEKCFCDRTMSFAEFERLAKEWGDSVTGDGHPDTMMESLTTNAIHIKSLLDAIWVTLNDCEMTGPSRVTLQQVYESITKVPTHAQTQ